MPHHEPLSALDELFLHLEGPNTPMHVGALATFEGPAPTRRTILDFVGARLERIPRARQKVQAAPLGLGRASWVDAADFDLRDHVRTATAEPPGDRPALESAAAAIMSQPLERTSPLWELSLVEGLADGRFALVSKTHHSVVDGVAGVEAISRLLESRPDGAPPARPTWTPRPAPSTEELAAAASLEGLARYARGIRGLSGRLNEPERLIAELRHKSAALADFVGGALRAPPSSLNRPIGPARCLETARVALSDLERMRAPARATINDVVLAGVAGGLRRLLEDRGEATDVALRCLVPVSTRVPADRGGAGNRVGALWVSLPVHEPHAGARLQLIAAETRALKDSGQVRGAQTLAGLVEHTPGAVLAAAARLVGRQRACNLAVSNLRGPDAPLFFAGHRMLEAYPMLPLIDNTSVSIGVLSYDGSLGFGLLGDRDTAPDLAVLSEGIEKTLAEMSGLS
jgi:diacylglycerol O-acyltransferase